MRWVVPIGCMPPFGSFILPDFLPKNKQLAEEICQLWREGRKTIPFTTACEHIEKEIQLFYKVRGKVFRKALRRMKKTEELLTRIQKEQYEQ